MNDCAGLYECDLSGLLVMEAGRPRDSRSSAYGIPESRPCPYQVDNLPGSSTLGYMLFELYPQPLIALPYATYYVRRGPLLVKPTDTVPWPLDEEIVLHRGKMLMYEWAEANQGRYPELQKTDWRFLMGAADEEFKDKLKDIRKLDRDICDNFIRTLKVKA